MEKISQKTLFHAYPTPSVGFACAFFLAFFLCLCSAKINAQVLVFDPDFSTPSTNEPQSTGTVQWAAVELDSQSSSLQPKRLIDSQQAAPESTFIEPQGLKTISSSSSEVNSSSHSNAVFAVPRQAYQTASGLTPPASGLTQYSSHTAIYNTPQSSYSSFGTIRLVDAVEPFRPGGTEGVATGPPAAGGGSANTVFPFGDWDPYSSGSGGSSWFSGTNNSEYYDQFQDISKKVARRFIERVSLDYTFIPRGKNVDGFGIHEVAYQTEFTFPCRFVHESEPLYLVPGIDLLWWDGPYGPPSHRRDMPSNAFGAYLEIGTAPRYTKDFAFELWGRAGVYSDFNKITSDAIRLSGNASVLVGLTHELEGVLGVVYLNRTRVKLLPRVGVIWKPNERVTWKLVFPDPKLTRELTRINNIDWKFYVQANYGGGCWEIRDTANDETLQMDYNDIRLGIGLEFTNHNYFNGYFEFGGAFGRELYTRHEAWCKPEDAIYLKAGFYF